MKAEHRVVCSGIFRALKGKEDKGIYIDIDSSKRRVLIFLSHNGTTIEMVVSRKVFRGMASLFSEAVQVTDETFGEVE